MLIPYGWSLKKSVNGEYLHRLVISFKAYLSISHFFYYPQRVS
jgi:hypothetical protein